MRRCATVVKSQTEKSLFFKKESLLLLLQRGGRNSGGLLNESSFELSATICLYIFKNARRSPIYGFVTDICLKMATTFNTFAIFCWLSIPFCKTFTIHRLIIIMIRFLRQLFKPEMSSSQTLLTRIFLQIFPSLLFHDFILIHNS